MTREEAADALVELYGYFRLKYNSSDRMTEAVSMAVASLRNEHTQSQTHITVPDKNTAKWIYDHWCEFKCSNCGTFSISNPRGKEKYCFNCGCKMKVTGTNDEE